MKMKYLFSEPENTACLVCSHVLTEGKSILYVSRDLDDGMWQFLCGAENHDSEHAKIVGLAEVVSRDHTVNDLHEMPLGFGATRESVDQKWQPFKNDLTSTD